MFVTIPTKSSRAVCLFARRAYWMFGTKGLFDTKGLPLNHSNSQRLVNVMPILVCTRIIECNANISSTPWSTIMVIANSAHVASFIILFALFTNCKPRIGKLDIELLIEARRCKRKDVSYRNGLWVHHLLSLEKKK